MPFTLTMPKLSPTMEEGSLAQWHKKVGDRVEVGDVLFEVATDKATIEYTALDEGWVRQILIEEGQSAKINQPVAILSEEEEEALEGYQPESAGEIVPQKTSLQDPTLSQVSAPAQHPTTRVLASPLAKKIAAQKGIDLETVSGTGPRQRIMSRDLEGAAPKSSAAPIANQMPGKVVYETLSPVRKVIAQRLQEAKSTIPHFYVQQTINAKGLLSLREHLKELEVAVSINDCIVKACALALSKHLAVNSGFNPIDNTIIRYPSIDICVAVSITAGLITPIIQHADNKSLVQLSSEIRALAKRAKENKLNPTEYQGGSFTISNLGMYGVSDFQAIINPPQAAILAVGGILDVPVVENGAVVPGKTMNLTLSADHRVIDGVIAAEFLQTLKSILEKPISLLVTK